MTRDEHKGIVNQLLGMVTPDNQATASELLTRLTDDYGQTLTDFETANDNVRNLTANNETLRRVNADLFLKVGNTNPKPTTEPEKGTDKLDPEKLTFEALFDEKGELK